MFGSVWCMFLLFCVLCICSHLAPEGSSFRNSAVDALDSAARLWGHGPDYVAPRMQHPNSYNKPAALSVSEPGRGTGARRKRVSPFISRKIAAAQSFRCAICSELLQEDWEIDHVRSLEEHGTNDLSNLQALHKKCHMLKTSMEQRRRWA